MMEQKSNPNLDKAKDVIKSMIGTCDMSAYSPEKLLSVSIERIIMQKFITSYLWEEVNDDLTETAFDALREEGLLQLNELEEYTLTTAGVDALLQK